MLHAIYTENRQKDDGEKNSESKIAFHIVPPQHISNRGIVPSCVTLVNIFSPKKYVFSQADDVIIASNEKETLNNGKQYQQGGKRPAAD
ncbi:MAG: hypothetical protein J6J19_06605 [Oscillospiraceae bacterium]|nr:hypothetical protein [Oscillospiraceae bacterium]